MATTISSTLANKPTDAGWKAVISSLEGQHGTEEWDVLGGQGTYWVAGQIWQAKCVTGLLKAGAHSVNLPAPAWWTIVDVHLVSNNTGSRIVVVSGTTFNITVPSEQYVILTVGPTQVTR